MRTHTKDDILKITTPIIAMLLAPPTDDLVDMVAAHLLATKAKADAPQALAAAEVLLAALRAAPNLPGRITFMQFYSLGAKDPQCDVMISDGTTSATLLGGIDEDTGSAYVVSEASRGNEDTKRRSSLKQLRAELGRDAERQGRIRSDMSSFSRNNELG